MKKLIALLMVITLAVCSFSFAAAENNPVIEGEDPFTGLPDNGEPFTPIVEVLDNNVEGYPHWGVGSASILFQIPNQSAHQTKMLALFSSEYPEKAGGSRSARMTAVAVAAAFDAAFTSAHFGPPTDAEVSEAVNVNTQLSSFGFRSAKKWYDLLSGNEFKERADADVPSDANLLAYINKIHQDLIAKGVTFEKRPFLFTDEALSRGDEAKKIHVWYYDNNGKGPYKASSTNFIYENGTYIREYGIDKNGATGVEADRVTGETLQFSNVIVLRSKLSWADGYTFFYRQLVGSGDADIFQNGRHIPGCWIRDGKNDRLVILDDEGNELKFQRGKSFIVLGSDKTDRMVLTYEAE